jgi:carbonic anhydrase
LQVTRRFLIVAAVLAAGCEQLKAPKRLKELEDRVAELSTQVDSIKGGKPGASLPKAGGHGGSDEPAHAGSGDGHAGSGDDHGSGDRHEGSGDGSGDGHGSGDSHAGSGDSHAGSDGHEGSADGDAGSGEAHAGSGDSHAGSGEAHAGSGETDDASAVAAAGDPPGLDAGAAEPLSKTDKALEDIAKLMASTRNKKPAAAAAKAAKPVPHAALRWGYDAKTGPPLWGSLDPAFRTCEQGKAQSPVDIEPRAGSASPITFHYQATPATIVDNGRTLQVNFARGNSIEIGDSTFQLLQLHFHTPSEHTIAGEHFPLEVHLVHRTASGKLAVVGVLFDVGAASASLGGLFAAWPRKVGVEAKLAKAFDPRTLLPETRTVFRYTGSLTTPPCTEGVMWNVMRRTLTDSRAHLDSFGQHYKINAREVWPLNDRKIE